MNIDDGDTENIVTRDSEDGAGNTGARAAGSGSRRRDPDSAYIPDPDAEKEDLDDNQGYTRITRGKARSVSSPMNTRISKKAAPTRAFIRISLASTGKVLRRIMFRSRCYLIAKAEGFGAIRRPLKAERVIHK